MENYLSQFTNAAIQYAPTVALALLTWLVGSWIINWLLRLLTDMMTKRNMDSSVRPFLVSIVEVGLKVMLLLTVAGMFGVQTTSFIAIFAALSFAIGTALSGSLAHFASGVLVLIFKPYKVGDLVTVAGQTGTVTAIQVFNTVLLTLDNKKIIVPNGAVTSGVITNISGQGQIRVDMLINVAGDSDIDKVRSVILEVANACPLVLKDPAAGTVVSKLPVGMIEFAVVPWCKSEHYWDVYFYMHEHLKKAFDKNGIALPKPGMEVAVSNK